MREAGLSFNPFGGGGLFSGPSMLLVYLAKAEAARFAFGVVEGIPGFSGGRRFEFQSYCGTAFCASFAFPHAAPR
jgi:hypothetical protein